VVIEEKQTTWPCNTPDLSVVIAMIAGEQQALKTCLEALEASIQSCRVECIVPYDARLHGVENLTKQFPWVTFVDARAEVDMAQFGTFSREHHDILRAIGLRRAQGNIVALLEDHGTPSQDWCTAVLDAHRGPYAVVGGAVENGVDRLLNWAVYYCDFGRYQNPVPAGPAVFLSDSNVAYKRAVLESVKEMWANAYHETSVHGELRRRGEQLRLEPQMVVYQTRRTLHLLPALQERYVWGRSYAGTRASEMTVVQRTIYANLAFVLPAVLSWRIVSQAYRKKRQLPQLMQAMPLIVLLQTIWSFGEFIGYVTGRTGGLQQHK
jgi:hypothetical protein